VSVIVFRDQMIACDSGVFDTSMHLCSVEKVQVRQTGAKCWHSGIVGRVSAMSEFQAWFNKGMKGPPPELDDQSEAFVVGPDGFHIVIGKGKVRTWLLKSKPFYAIGSGAEVAMGAMAQGADAYQAVKIACDLKMNVAPPICVYQTGFVPCFKESELHDGALEYVIKKVSEAREEGEQVSSGSLPRSRRKSR